MGGGSPFFNAQIIRLFQSLEYYSKIYHMLGLVLQSKIADLLATIFVLEINSLPHVKESGSYRGKCRLLLETEKSSFFHKFDIIAPIFTFQLDSQHTRYGYSQ
jgi:hypothetical protein